MTDAELDRAMILGKLCLYGKDESSGILKWHSLEIKKIAEDGDVEFFKDLGRTLSRVT